MIFAAEIGQRRLLNQQVAGLRGLDALAVVSRIGAMQAQDYQNAVWAIGLRTQSARESAVQEAIASRQIVRTWPMRGTLHFVPARDVLWMLKLLTPRIIAGSAKRIKNLELDATIFRRCEKIFVKALQGDKQHTREALLTLLSDNGIPVDSQRGYHILCRLAQEGVICFAARSGKQPTFALLEEWVSDLRRLEGEAAVAELALRYFKGHGPATIQDFVWWSGLKVSEAKAGLGSIASQLQKEVVEGVTYWMDQKTGILPTGETTAFLLPAFDEYLLGYKDRSAVLDPHYANRIVPGSNGVFLPTLVVNGKVVGTWKRTVKKRAAVVTLTGFVAFKKREKIAAEAAVHRFGELLETPVEVVWDKSE